MPAVTCVYRVIVDAEASVAVKAFVNVKVKELDQVPVHAVTTWFTLLITKKLLTNVAVNDDEYEGVVGAMEHVIEVAPLAADAVVVSVKMIPFVPPASTVGMSV